MPFITEKLWVSLVNKEKFLMNQNFTTIQYNTTFNESRKYILKIIEVMTSLRNLRANLNISYKNEINVQLDTNNNNLKNFCINFQKKLQKLIKIKSIKFEKIKSQKKSAFIVLNDITILVPLEGIVDTEKEILKLQDKKYTHEEKLKQVLDRLNNKAFIDKAPDNVIENYKLQEKEINSSIEKINEIMNTIK